MNLTYLVLTFIALFFVAFFSGMGLVIGSKSLFRRENLNAVWRVLKYLCYSSKCRYIMCFAAGVTIAVVFELSSSHHHFYRWAGVYDDALLGSMIKDKPEILETGQIPQDLLDWYADYSTEK